MERQGPTRARVDPGCSPLALTGTGQPRGRGVEEGARSFQHRQEVCGGEDGAMPRGCTGHAVCQHAWVSVLSWSVPASPWTVS